jgi:small subunit ribosomal protein S24e
MELEIREKRENPLLDRVEVRFLIRHPNQPTPRRENIREELSKELKVPKDRVIVDNMSSSFGLQETKGYAKVYSKKESALEIERTHLLKRNKLIIEEKKKEEAPEEKPSQDEEKKEEKPPEKEKKPAPKKKAEKEETAEEPAKEE